MNAQVALVELDLQVTNQRAAAGEDQDLATAVPKPVLIIFAIVTTLLVSVHLLALMMSTCMLPHMEALGTTVANSPHHKLRYYIEMSWFFSTCLGLILFLLEIGIVFWIKFTEINYPQAAYAATVLLVPVFFIFLLFTYHFYRKLMAHHVTRLHTKLQQMQREEEEELRKYTAASAAVDNYHASTPPPGTSGGSGVPSALQQQRHRHDDSQTIPLNPVHIV